jgi:hypothetical protein
MEQLQNSFAVSGFASVEQQVLKVQGLTCASCKSLQDFIIRPIIAKECLEDLSVPLPESYHIIQLLRGLGHLSKHGHAKYITRVSINSISPLCAEAPNEEQSIKRNEIQSVLRH